MRSRLRNFLFPQISHGILCNVHSIFIHRVSHITHTATLYARHTVNIDYVNSNHEHSDLMVSIQALGKLLYSENVNILTIEYSRL